MFYISTHPYIRWIPAVVWGIVIMVLSLMPGGPGNMIFFGIPHFDKIGHFGMYAVWTFLFSMAFHFPRTASGIKAIWKSILIGALAGVILEFGQKLMHQRRSFEVADMIANVLGAAMGAWVGNWYFGTRRPS